MAFNITSRALLDTATLHLKDPETELPMYADEDEKEPLEIVLYGRTSKQYRNWLAIATRKADAEKAKNKGNPKSKTPDEQLEDTADFLAALSIKANNFTLEDGKPIATKEQFKELYGNPAMAWVGEQVGEILGDNSAFLK